MSIVRELAGTLAAPCFIPEERDKKGKIIEPEHDFPKGTPIVMVGDYVSPEGKVGFICVEAGGRVLVIPRRGVSITITKELRERLAEATLSS